MADPLSPMVPASEGVTLREAEEEPRYCLKVPMNSSISSCSLKSHAATPVSSIRDSVRLRSKVRVLLICGVDTGVSLVTGGAPEISRSFCRIGRKAGRRGGMQAQTIPKLTSAIEQLSGNAPVSVIDASETKCGWGRGPYR